MATEKDKEGATDTAVDVAQLKVGDWGYVFNEGCLEWKCVCVCFGSGSGEGDGGGVLKNRSWRVIVFFTEVSRITPHSSSEGRK